MKFKYKDFKEAFLLLSGGNPTATIFLHKNYAISNLENGRLGFIYYDNDERVESNCPLNVVYEAIVRDENIYELLKQHS